MVKVGLMIENDSDTADDDNNSEGDEESNY